MNFIRDGYYAQRFLIEHTVTVAEANAMVRSASVTRDLADYLLFQLCMQPLDEAGEQAFVSPFWSFVRLREREPEGAIQDVPTPVASILVDAADGYSRENCFRRADHVLAVLGAPSSSPREQALTLFARVAAARIRDAVTHPVFGATVMAWPYLNDIDEGIGAAAIRTSADLKRQWADRHQGRARIEASIESLAQTLPWPDR